MSDVQSVQEELDIVDAVLRGVLASVCELADEVGVQTSRFADRADVGSLR